MRSIYEEHRCTRVIARLIMQSRTQIRRPENQFPVGCLCGLPFSACFRAAVYGLEGVWPRLFVAPAAVCGPGRFWPGRFGLDFRAWWGVCAVLGLEAQCASPHTSLPMKRKAQGRNSCLAAHGGTSEDARGAGRIAAWGMPMVAWGLVLHGIGACISHP